MNELSRRTGIAVGILSHYENGRMIPTADDFDKAWAAFHGDPAT